MAVVLGRALERGRGAARRVGERLPHQEGSIQTRTLWEQLLSDFSVAIVTSTLKLGKSIMKTTPVAVLHHALKMRAFLEWRPYQFISTR